MPDTIKSGANAPEYRRASPPPPPKPIKEHLTPEELRAAWNYCDRMDGCRECPNLTPGTLGDLGGCDIGECRFDLHDEVSCILSHRMPVLSEETLGTVIELLGADIEGLDSLSERVGYETGTISNALLRKRNSYAAALMELEKYRKAVEG